MQESALASVAAEIAAASPNAQVLTTTVNVSNNESVQAWMDSTIARFGKLDGAANLAGIFRGIPDHSVEKEIDSLWDEILLVNLTGVMYCMRAQLPLLGKGGSVVNAASILGISGAAGAADYSASKHGVRSPLSPLLQWNLNELTQKKQVVGITRSAAKEVGKKGVRVNCFAPGYIETPMLRASFADRGSDATKSGGYTSVALERMGQPIEVAKLIAFLLSDESSFITGNVISIDGGWNC
jgi:NAD(P)-dependent dehydrogenase (short-subunit alcohol dehydrogenase family)